jgi:hypothetical protein
MNIAVRNGLNIPPQFSLGTYGRGMEHVDTKNMTTKRGGDVEGV